MIRIDTSCLLTCTNRLMDMHEPNHEPRHPSLVDAVTTAATLVCIRWRTRHPSWCIAITVDLGKTTLLLVCDPTILTPFWRTWYSHIFQTDSLVRRLMIPPHLSTSRTACFCSPRSYIVILRVLPAHQFRHCFWFAFAGQPFQTTQGTFCHWFAPRCIPSLEDF